MSRPDFLLIYHAEIKRERGMHPEKLRKYDEIESFESKLFHFYDPRLRKAAEEIALMTGETYEYLEMAVHGGFDPVSNKPNNPITGEEYDIKEIKDFRALGQREYMRVRNEAEYHKVMKHKEYLLKQREEFILDEFALRRIIQWENEFHLWFTANGLSLPEFKVNDRPSVNDAPPEKANDSVFQHTSDFRSVRLRGKLYNLTPKQAQAVQILYEAYQKGTPEVGQHSVLEELESPMKRLRDVFKKNQAWGKLIISGRSKGTVRLNM